MWIIYTDLVHTAAAHRHLRELAPFFHQVKECWPDNHKVRLPGGKYMKPGFRRWCKLYDANGALLAEDGANSSCILLTYQTPAQIAPEYPSELEQSPAISPKESESRSVAATAQWQAPCDDQMTNTASRS